MVLFFGAPKRVPEKHQFFCVVKGVALFFPYKKKATPFPKFIPFDSRWELPRIPFALNHVQSKWARVLAQEDPFTRRNRCAEQMTVHCVIP
jgi:hypothetical protein